MATCKASNEAESIEKVQITLNMFNSLRFFFNAIINIVFYTTTNI